MDQSRPGVATTVGVEETLYLEVQTPNGVQRVEITARSKSPTVVRLRIVAGDTVKISKTEKKDSSPQVPVMT